jgi:transposase
MDVTGDSSSFERPRRIEFLNGVERRRPWTVAMKAQIVGESLVPGAIVAEVARRHDIRASQIQLWRLQALEGQLSSPPVAFAPVIVSEASALAEPHPATLVEIEAGPIRIAVRTGADATLVEAIVRALRARL